jgi:hypothetical protein
MWLVVAAGLLTVEIHDSRPAAAGRTQLQLGATLVSVDGTVLDPAGEWTVLAGGAPLATVEPESWAAGDGDLVIAIVVKDVPELAGLAEAARPALARLGGLPRARVTTATAGAALLAAVATAVDQLDAAMAQRAGPPRRCVVVVVADGLDVDPDPLRYTNLGIRANGAGVRIHTLAWHPQGDRRPMLGLAELSARSNGTFRMVAGTGPALAASLDARVGQLVVELGEQPQLFVDAPAGAHQLKLRHGSGATAIESRNQLTVIVPAPEAGERGRRWWLLAGPALLVAGGAAAVMVVRRRRARKAAT